MSFLPAMIVNGEHSNYKNGDDWGMVYCWYPEAFPNIHAQISRIQQLPERNIQNGGF